MKRVKKSRQSIKLFKIKNKILLEKEIRFLITINSEEEKGLIQ